MTFFVNVVACRAKKRGSGVGKDVPARPAAEGRRPFKLTHLRPDVFDVAWWQWDVVGKAVGKGEPLSVWHNHKGVSTEDGCALGTFEVLFICVSIPMEDIGARKMTSTADKGNTGQMWESKDVLIHFCNVALTRGNVGMSLGRIEATLIPIAVGLGNEDVAIEHLGPGQAGAEEVGVRNEDSGDFSGGADVADMLHELHRDEAATIPDDGTGLCEEHKGSLSDSDWRIKLDAKDAWIRVLWDKLERSLGNQLPWRRISLTCRAWILSVICQSHDQIKGDKSARCALAVAGAGRRW